MTGREYAFCSFCGTTSPTRAGPPATSTCVSCGNTTYLNPRPVGLGLVPVGDGLLLVRRGIEPGYGKLALPGGYMEMGETWREAVAREVREETGYSPEPADAELFRMDNSGHGNLLVFCTFPRVEPGVLPPFEPDAETLEVTVAHAPCELAFPAQTAAMAEWFAARAVAA